MSQDETGRDLVPVNPYVSWTDAQWKEFVHVASEMQMDAILEKGWRIREFHLEFNRNSSRWSNREWAVVCRAVIKIHKSTCSIYERIYQVFGGVTDEVVRRRLPVHMYSLYLVAQAYEIDPWHVRHCIETGRLSPETERDDAQKILDFIKTGEVGEVVEASDLPQSQQPGAKRRAVKTEASVENAIGRRMAEWNRRGFSDETLSKLAEDPDFFDEVQDLRKQYGDRDFFERWKWLLRTEGESDIEDGRSGDEAR
jgi:hypothetical protein